MARYKIHIEYEGTNLVGWQKQKNGISVQEILENALFKLTGEKKIIQGAGRTDAGVHALNQVAHFDIIKKINTDALINYKLLKKHYRWGVAFAFSDWKNLVMWRGIKIKHPPNHFLNQLLFSLSPE